MPAIHPTSKTILREWIRSDILPDSTANTEPTTAPDVTITPARVSETASSE